MKSQKSRKNLITAMTVLIALALGFFALNGFFATVWNDTSPRLPAVAYLPETHPTAAGHAQPSAADNPSAMPAITTTTAPLVQQPVSTKPKVYLTFDDGPSKNTEEILSILKMYGARATFFVMDTSYNYILSDIIGEGHAVGLHTASHNYEEIYSSEEAFWSDIQKISDVVKDEIGLDVKIMRFAGGGSNAVSRKYSKGIMTSLTRQAGERGFVYFDWNCDVKDASGDDHSPEDIYFNMVKVADKLKGDINVLLHDRADLDSTVKALPWIISYFRARGYEFDVITTQTTPIHHKVVN